MNKNDLIYICSPLSAPTKEGIQKNMERAAHYARLVSGTFGCRAIAPHSFLPKYLDDNIPEEREAGLAFGLSVLRLSKAMPVEQIYSMLNRDSAAAVVIPMGFNKGKTLGQIALDKPTDLKWYVDSYGGPDNLLRAAAKFLIDMALGQAG